MAPLARYEYARDEPGDPGSYLGLLEGVSSVLVFSSRRWLIVRGLLLDGSPLVGDPTDAHVQLDESLRFGVCAHAQLLLGYVHESAALARGPARLAFL